jgi:hypothetical protein
MPTAILKSFTRKRNGKVQETSTTATITHNNRRLYHHTDGETYEYVGDDASGNRIYRNARKARG